ASVIGPLMAPNRPLYWESFNINSFIYAALTLDGVVMPRVDSSRPGPAGSAINEINGSLWTIRCEFLCYLGLSLLGLTGALRRRGWVLGLFSVSLAAYCINVQMSKDIIAYIFSAIYYYLDINFYNLFNKLSIYSLQWPRL